MNELGAVLLPVLLLALVIWMVVKTRKSKEFAAFAAAKVKGGRFICRNCGHVSDGRPGIKGSGWIELVLWLAVIVPGLIYSIWRRSRVAPVCPQCGKGDLIPTTSPMGQKLLAELGQKPPGVPT